MCPHPSLQKLMCYRLDIELYLDLISLTYHGSYLFQKIYDIWSLGPKNIQLQAQEMTVALFTNVFCDPPLNPDFHPSWHFPHSVTLGHLIPTPMALHHWYI